MEMAADTLAEDFEQHGAGAIRICRIEEPSRYVHHLTHLGLLEAVKRDAPVVAEDLKPAHTTTYSRVTVPDEIEPLHEPTEWRHVCVEVARPTDTDPGAIEEAQYAISGGQILLRDMDGYSLGDWRLEPGEDPATAARRLLRGKVPKRMPLVFPNMGVA
jgi:hypothetical protein